MRSKFLFEALVVLGVAAAGIEAPIAPAAAMEVDISAGPTGNGCTVFFQRTTRIKSGRNRDPR